MIRHGTAQHVLGSRPAFSHGDCRKPAWEGPTRPQRTPLACWTSLRSHRPPAASVRPRQEGETTNTTAKCTCVHHTFECHVCRNHGFICRTFARGAKKHREASHSHAGPGQDRGGTLLPLRRLNHQTVHLDKNAFLQSQKRGIWTTVQKKFPRTPQRTPQPGPGTGLPHRAETT